jgi:NADH-quinone oxidoreductase subunit D
MTVTEDYIDASGGDWDDVIEKAQATSAERLVVNMGPQHPSTHGVLRLILTLDGETCTEARVAIGYLHTGIEKNMEFRTWTQGTTFCTRMDYVAPLFQEAAYCLAVEKLLGITDDVPERASVIRVLMMELNRIASHLVWLATTCLELGADRAQDHLRRRVGMEQGAGRREQDDTGRRVDPERRHRCAGAARPARNGSPSPPGSR